MARASAEERLARVLAMIPWVVERGGATVSEIAERFALAERDVLAELSLVQCCEIPPYGPDHTLGIAVVDGEVLVEPSAMLARPLRLAPSEGFGLLAAGHAALAVPGADLEGVLASAIAKLERVLGERAPVAVDFDAPPVLEQLQDAVNRQVVVEIDYFTASRDDSSTRVVEPVGLVHTDGNWYLRAFCRLADDWRTFRVDRIDRLDPLDERHDREVADDDRTFALTEDDLLPVVRLRLPASARWVAETYPTFAVGEPADVDGDDDGAFEVELPVSGAVWLERLLLRVGPEARVVDVVDEGRLATAQVDHREVGRAAARRLLERYAAS